jgi:hypothetical protein
LTERKLLANELDTSWFDIKNYESLKSMSIEDWARLLKDRYNFYHAVNIYENHHRPNNIVDDNLVEFLANAVACLRRGFSSVFIGDTSKFLPSSVNDLSLFDVWMMAQDGRLIHVQPDRCKDEFSEIALQPFGIDLVNYRTTVNINLSATDTQIKKDFNHWLRRCRKETGHYDHAPKKKSQKKLANKELYTQKDFDEWTEYGVIPYLDIVLIAKIEGKEIPPYHEMGRLLFPAIHVDCVGRVRDTTKPIAEWLIKSDIHRTLLTQLASEKVGG